MKSRNLIASSLFAVAATAYAQAQPKPICSVLIPDIEPPRIERVLAYSGDPAAPREAAVLDVLVLYTPNAKSPLDDDNDGDVGPEISKLFADANQIWRNSELNATMNVVHVAVAPLSLDLDVSTAPLDAMKSDRSTAALRAAFRADVVIAFVDDHNLEDQNTCGQAWLYHKHSTPRTMAEYAFAWVRTTSCASGRKWYQVLAHEVGHLLGAHHAQHHLSAAEQSVVRFPYAYGYVEPRKGINTNMAYPTGRTHTIDFLSSSSRRVKVVRGKSHGPAGIPGVPLLDSLNKGRLHS